MQIFLWALLCYILYRFIVGFVIPVATTASRVRRQFREMNRQASAFTGTQEQNGFKQPDDNSDTISSPHQNWTTSGKKADKEDYIDFEEVPKQKP